LYPVAIEQSTMAYCNVAILLKRFSSNFLPWSQSEFCFVINNFDNASFLQHSAIVLVNVVKVRLPGARVIKWISPVLSSTSLESWDPMRFEMLDNFRLFDNRYFLNTIPLIPFSPSALNFLTLLNSIFGILT